MKTYTITIEIQAESEQEAFSKLEAAVNGSSDFSMLRHRLDSCTVEEYDESEYFTDEDQMKLFEKLKEEHEN